MLNRLYRHGGLKSPFRQPEKSPDRAWRVSPVVLGVLAVGWAIGFMTVHGYQHRPPSAEEAAIACHLAAGHGFRSPMDPSPTAPPSAYSAPLYPLVIAGAYRLFGIASPAAVTALMLVNAVFFGIIVVSAERLATLLFKSQIPGLLAAGLLAVHPLFLFYMADFWDGFMSLALFALLTVAALRLNEATESGGRTGLVAAAGLGIGMGLLALTNTSYALCFPVLLCFAFRQPRRVSRWRSAAIACAAGLIVVLPWTIRNYVAFGRLIPIRTSSGVQLWLCNTPISDGYFNDRTIAFHPYVNPEERALFLALGEPAYDELAFKRFEHGLVASPSGYLARCLRRSLYLLIGNVTEPVGYPLLRNWQWRGVYGDSLVLNASVTILGFAGMIAAYRLGYRQRGVPVLAASVALPFIPIGVVDRYSLPLRWLLVIYAGVCLWLLFRHRRGKVGTVTLPPETSPGSM
jgi:hypothetical protein